MKQPLAAVLAVLATAGAALAQPISSPPTAAPAFPVGPAWDANPGGVGIWAQADYLLWGIKSAPVPVPLVTAGPGTPNQTPVLGNPAFPVVLGGQDVNFGGRSGARFTLGAWFDDEQTFGASVTYLFLGAQSDVQGVRSGARFGEPGLALPFFDVTAPGESSTRIAFPGGFSGTAVLGVTNSLQSWEANGLARLYADSAFRLHLLGGFRFFNFNERLAFDTSSPSLIPPADIFVTLDHFSCRNHFYGGQIGAQAEYGWGSLFVRSQAKVALGAMHEVVVISGQLVTNDFNGFAAPQVFPGGYLAQPTNNGKQAHTRFAVIPEVGATLGWRVTSYLNLLVGYTFLYASSVVRPGEQIDRGINPTQAPAITGVPSTTVVGAPRPAPLFNTTDFWAQGVNFGLELRF